MVSRVVGAALAGRAALGPALQPLEHPQPRRDGERRSQRTQVAAEEALDAITRFIEGLVVTVLHFPILLRRDDGLGSAFPDEIA